MLLGVAEALVAAFLYGLSTVLQALAARASAPVEGADPRLVIRLLRSWRFVVGTVMDVCGFLLAAAATRSIPLFAVQAIVAANLAFTALIAAVFLQARLSRREWAGIGVVTTGLALVGLAAAAEGPPRTDLDFRLAMLATASGLVLLTILASRVERLGRPLVIATLSGLQFGVVSLCARVLDGFEPVQLLTDPAAYGLALAGAFGFFAHTAALQRGAVTTAVAAVVVGETLFPALVGVLLLGDRPRHGYAIPAAIGFVAAVGGALSLARYGEIPAPVEADPPGDGPSADSGPDGHNAVGRDTGAHRYGPGTPPRDAAWGGGSDASGTGMRGAHTPETGLRRRPGAD